MKKVAVFCGASLGFNDVYKNTAIELGNYLANAKIGMVYGAGKVGMMGAIAEAMLAKQGEVIGVIPDLLQHEEVMHNSVSELIVTKTMSQRKMAISKLVDAYITLPGGFGTLDEIFEALTLQQLYIERKPVGLLNINGFFNPLLQQLELMVKEGFLQQKNRDMLFVNTTIEGLIQQLSTYKAPKNTSVINKVVKNDN